MALLQAAAMPISPTYEASPLAQQVDRIITENRRIMEDIELQFQSRQFSTDRLLLACEGRLEALRRAADPARFWQ